MTVLIDEIENNNKTIMKTLINFPFRDSLVQIIF